MGPVQPALRWVLSSGLKRPEHEANHSLPSSAEVINEWSYASTTTCVCMTCLVTGYFFGVVSYKASHALRPLLIYCASPSEFQ
jgi:hypothetical protein